MLQQKATTYIGKSCPHNHEPMRYTKTNRCVECVRLYRSKQTLAQKEKARSMQASYAKKRYHEFSPERILYNLALSRASKLQIEFNITPDYIKSIWPRNNLCPIYHVQMIVNKGGKCANSTSPTLDRINPRLGYVCGNIAVISSKANRLKNNETESAVFRRLAEWMDQYAV